MAVYYLRSTDGSDASDGLSWANAKATMIGALAVATAADSIQVSQVHAETAAAAIALTFPATPGLQILCVDDGAEPSVTLATTATVTTTGNNALTFVSGFAYIYGVIFSSGTGASAAADMLIGSSTTVSKGFVFDTCKFQIASTSTSAPFFIGSTSSTTSHTDLIQFISCQFKFGAVTTINIRGGKFRFSNLSLDSAGSTPTDLFTIAVTSVQSVDVIVEESDLSGEAFTNLIDSTGEGSGQFLVRNCKLPSSIVVQTGTIAFPGATIVKMHNCDSADTNYRLAQHSYEGVVTQETTIVQTGGASDGTTTLSRKMVSSASTLFFDPLYGPEIPYWNETTGSAITVTVEFVHDSVTNLQDDEIWLEVSYLGFSGTPRGAMSLDRMAGILSTPADQTDSSATWTTTGLTNPNTQKLVVSVTAQEKGYILARVALAKPSTTVYYDHKLTIS